MKKQMLLLAMMLLPVLAWADDSGSCGDNVTWTYVETTRTLIISGTGDMYDFSSSSEPWKKYWEDVRSIIIEDGVTSLTRFWCWNVTTVTIPKSVQKISGSAFAACEKLQSVNISDLEAWCNIDFGSGGDNPSGNAHASLILNGTMTRNLVIPNGVKKIKKYAFQGFNNINTVTFPNTVTSIGSYAFYSCDDLTTIKFGENIETIEQAAFCRCDKLDNVEIPNSVTTIGVGAFSASGIEALSIGRNVKSIGLRAFNNTKLLTVVSLIEDPFKISGKAATNSQFSNTTFGQGTLYVPKGTIDKYKAAEGWKDFLHIEEGTGGGGGGTTPKKCAKPTISYKKGKLTYHCETEGAEFQSTITDTDIKSYGGNEVQLTVTYIISVYATKSGYENSDIATATLCWIDVEPKTEGIVNGVACIPSKPVLIQSNGCTLSISGIDEGTPIRIYDISGKMVGSAKAASESTFISTSLNPGDVGLVKIGEKTIKIIMK